MSIERSELFPPKGAPCGRFPKCRRAPTRYGWIARLAGGRNKWRFIHERVLFCEIHAIENEFGLEAYRCPSRTCLRRRIVASGGWLNVRAKPEVSYVYIPLEATLDDDFDDEEATRRKPSPFNSLVRCPWCETPMKLAR